MAKTLCSRDPVQIRFLDPLRPPRKTPTKKPLETTIEKFKRGTIEGQHMETMGENQFARENTLSKALNTIMK